MGETMSKYVSLVEFLSILEELVPMLDNSECPSKFSTDPYQSGYRSAVHCIQVFVRDGQLDFFDKEDASVRYIRREDEEYHASS
jgi:hypothetical protein